MTNQEMKNHLIEFIVYFVLCDGLLVLIVMGLTPWVITMLMVF